MVVMVRFVLFLLNLATSALSTQAFKATFAEELKELSASPFGSTLVGKPCSVL